MVTFTNMLWKLAKIWEYKVGKNANSANYLYFCENLEFSGANSCEVKLSILVIKSLVYHVETLRRFISPSYLIWACVP